MKSNSSTPGEKRDTVAPSYKLKMMAKYPNTGSQNERRTEPVLDTVKVRKILDIVKPVSMYERVMRFCLIILRVIILACLLAVVIYLLSLVL